jgi:hypothetical protein
LHRACGSTTGAEKMFRSFVQAIFRYDDPLTDDGYDVIKAKNECGEDRYIAVCTEDANIDILITKCKKLLSFVESRGLERKYAHALMTIERCAELGGDLDPLFENYDRIKKRVTGCSERNLSDWDVQRV